MVEIAHERAAGELAGHLARGTAHVDIDDVGAALLGNACAFRHPAHFTSGELYDEGAQFTPGEATQNMRSLTDQILTCHHLGHDEPGTQTVSKPAEWQVGYARHWSEQNAVGQ